MPRENAIVDTDDHPADNAVLVVAEADATSQSVQRPTRVNDNAEATDAWIRSFERPPLNMAACPARLGTTEPAGISVPAVVEGKVAEVDLAELEEESLVALLRANGGAWTERLVCHLLGWSAEHAAARAKPGSALKRLRKNHFLGNLFLLEVDPDHRSGRGRWWRANRAGYTDLVSQAGLYAVDETDELDCRPRSVAAAYWTCATVGVSNRVAPARISPW